MEEFHLPSHLIKNIDKLGNYKYKYRHNTLIAFDEDAIKVLSHSMTLLEPTEAPSIEFSREIEYYPSKKIDDAFIFRSGVYSINNTASRTYFGKRKYSSNISLFQMDWIDKETKINFDAQIICHVDTTSSTKDDLLIILTDENDLYFYNISIDMTIYKKNISAYLNNEALNSVDMFVADYKDILGVHLNKKTLILFNLNEIENSLVVDSFNNKIIAINMILHTNSIIITIQNIYENEVQIQFNILKMFNDSEQLSVCSEPEQVDTLECVIDDFLVIDICFLHETNNMLILSKSHDHNINLHLLWIEVIGQEIKPVLTQINSKHLSSVDDHISWGKINHDSIWYSGPGQFSVNAELFIADKLKFLVYEFSNVNQKQAEKFNPELILNSIEIPEHISNKISNISEIDFSSDSDFDAFLQIGNLEYFGAELLKKDLEQYKYNLAKLKDWLDKKLEEFLSHIQPDDSQHTLKEKLKYLSSLETIYRYISYRRTIEAERNKCLRKMDKLSNSDIKDIQKIDIKAEEVAQIKQWVWYFSLITKHNVFLSFQNKSKSITKVMELKRSSKKSHYSQRFDNIEKKYIHFKDLFIDIIIKESGVEAKYPFESNQDLFRFMTTNVSKNTMDFVMIYFLLDIYGLEVFEIEVGQAIEEVEDFREYLAYWLVDYSYAEYQSLNIISENFNKCLECINHPYSNNIEYIGAILQSFHELSSVRNSKLLGSEFQIFLKEKFSIGSSGNINDLGYYRENDLTILIYNLWKYENYSQAYLILNSKQEDQYFNSAFFILAYSLIKNNRLIDLINYDLTEKQKELLYKLLENEWLVRAIMLYLTNFNIVGIKMFYFTVSWIQRLCKIHKI